MHFLSAVCALPSGSVRVQSSQNRHCWSLAVSPRSGASTLTSECSLQHSLAIIFTELFNTLFRCSLHLLSLGTLGSALTSSLNYVFSCNLSEWLFFFCSSSSTAGSMSDMNAIIYRREQEAFSIQTVHWVYEGCSDVKTHRLVFTGSLSGSRISGSITKLINANTVNIYNN